MAPWKPRAKMSIRGPEGTILSPEDQLQALLDHSTRKFWHGDPYISEHRMTVDFTVTEQEVERLVSKTPLCKAVAESVAPSAVWKLCAASVSRVIVRALRSSWGAEMPALIPQHWKDSQLVWIAKPNKDSSKPQGYRPLDSPIHLPRFSTSSLEKGSSPTWNRSTCPSLPTAGEYWMRS